MGLGIQAPVHLPKTRNRDGSGSVLNGIAERLFTVAARLDEGEDKERGNKEHKQRWKT